MATRTTNLGLIKPDLDDNIDVTQLNANSDIIDDKVQANTNSIEAVKQELPKYLPLVGGTLTGDLQTANVNVGGHIYKTSNDRTLIIGGGVDYNNGSTLDLCGNSREDGVYAQLHCNNNYLQVHSNGNTYIGGEHKLVNKDGNYIRMASINDSSYVEANTDGNIYINGDTYVHGNVYVNDTVLQGIAGDELQIKSPNGQCNLAINNDGYAWLNGTEIWSDKFNVINGDNVTFKLWNVNEYTRIMHITVINDSPSSGLRRKTITFPLPFSHDSYIAVVSGITQSSYTGDEKVRVNTHCSCVTGQHTTTGMMIVTDAYNNTEILVIGRIK